MLKSTLCALSDLIRHMSFSTQTKKVTIYSEGFQYWDHLKDVLFELLKQPGITVLYVSSQQSDPVLHYKHKSLETFFIGNGFIRDYFFQNLKSDIMILTTPDLDISRIKRSKFQVRYVYLQHSLVSLHRVYNEGAFNSFDIICCGGPHHLKEAQKLFQIKGLSDKKLIKFGYPRLEHLKSSCALDKLNRSQVLIAPSWGKQGLIETRKCMALIEELLDQGYRVILRPHPETVKRNKSEVSAIEKKFSISHLFSIETDMGENSTLAESEILITDWSGIAFEYAFTFHRAVIFADITTKVKNKNYNEIDLPVAEEELRNEIGVVWDLNTEISCALQKISQKNIDYDLIMSKYYFRFGPNSLQNLFVELGIGE